MSEGSICVRAYAKINLFLDVTGRLENGYHLVDLVMQSIDLHDTLIFTPAESGRDTLFVTDAEGLGRFGDLGTDESNLVIRAVRSLRKKYPERFPDGSGLDIRLEKRIPSQAGLAGGSADAAAALLATDRIFSLGLDGSELEETALALGADVPFCLRCGTLRARGIGEVLSPLPPMPDCALVVVKPYGNASTRDIYNAIDNEDIRHPDCAQMTFALSGGDIRQVSSALANIMEPITASRVPDVNRAVSGLLSSGALGARMSGSGSAVFGIFPDNASAEIAAVEIKAAGFAESVYVTAPISADDAAGQRFLQAE